MSSASASNGLFYSPLAKWAAGVAWSQGWSRYQVFDTEGAVLSDHALSPATLDIWTGRGFHLGDGTEPGSQNSNFVLAARYAQTRYATRPPRALDPLGVYSDNSLFLVSTGISIRQYYKERYLFRFGNAEDVPEGLLLTFTTGVEKRELTVNRPYVGADVSRGRNYAGFGYLNVGLGYGTFFQTGDVVDGALNMRVLYFTDLRNWGRWHFRQFFRFNAVYGYNKPDYASVNLNGSQLYGFSSGTLTGHPQRTVPQRNGVLCAMVLFGLQGGTCPAGGFRHLGWRKRPALFRPHPNRLYRGPAGSQREPVGEHLRTFGGLLPLPAGYARRRLPLQQLRFPFPPAHRGLISANRRRCRTIELDTHHSRDGRSRCRPADSWCRV
jgi:hypothetical protein